MNLINEIRLAIAVRSGVSAYFREQHALVREAGRKDKSNDNMSKNTHAENPKPENKQQPSKKPNKKQEEQKKKAEAESPVEPAGAEKVHAEAPVAEDTQAAMGTMVGVQDPSAGSVRNFGIDGINIDMAALSGRPGASSENMFNHPPMQQPPVQEVKPNFNPGIPPIGQEHSQFDMVSGFMQPREQVDAGTFNPAVAAFQQQQAQQQVVAPNFIPQSAPPQQYQIPQQPMAGSIPTQPVVGTVPINQQQVVGQMNTPAGYGRHKGDMVPKPPKQKRQKGEPEKVATDGMPNIKKGLEITENPKQVFTTINPINEDMEKPEHDPVAVVAVESKFSAINQPIFEKYPYLKEIEELANKNGYQMTFDVRPTGLICCLIGNADGVVIPAKGFTIDTGCIIDRQKKIYPVISEFYEDYNPFPLYVKVGDKKKKVLNTEILTDLIVAGNDSVVRRKGLYSRDFIETNKYCALITIPTKNITPETRKYIQDRLTALYKDNTLSNALAGGMGRFRIAEYNTATNIMILDTYGVPHNYGGACYVNDRVQIRVTQNKAKIIKSNFIPIADIDRA